MSKKIVIALAVVAAVVTAVLAVTLRHGPPNPDYDAGHCAHEQARVQYWAARGYDAGPNQDLVDKFCPKYLD